VGLKGVVPADMDGHGFFRPRPVSDADCWVLICLVYESKTVSRRIERSASMPVAALLLSKQTFGKGEPYGMQQGRHVQDKYRRQGLTVNQIA
jgi:hypothetical protein